MADRIQLRRDLANVWSATNPVLSDGEPGVERDTGRMKIGNGTTPWNGLPYVGGGSGGDLNYTHTQATPSTTWIVSHNLGKFPSVTVVDSSGEEVEGDVMHDSANALRILFSAGFSGVAYLN